MGYNGGNGERKDRMGMGCRGGVLAGGGGGVGAAEGDHGFEIFSTLFYVTLN